MKTGKYIQNELLCGYCTGSGLDAGQEYCKPCRGTGLETQRIFNMSELRDLEHELNSEKITYSRFIEKLNAKATKFMYDWIKERI